MRLTCSECGKEFHPHRVRIFDHDAATCAKPECQRKRKTRLQRERRDLKRSAANRAHIESLRQSRPTLPQITGKVKLRGSTLPLRQRRSSLPQRSAK